MFKRCHIIRILLKPLNELKIVIVMNSHGKSYIVGVDHFYNRLSHLHNVGLLLNDKLAVLEGDSVLDYAAVRSNITALLS